MAPSWTDERCELLRKYFAENKAASEIAAALGGVTRNAVIGKLHRLGLMRKDGLAPRAGRPKSKIKSRPNPAYSRLITPKKRNTTEEDRISNFFTPPEQPARPYDGAPIGLLDLSNASCRWPVAEGRRSEFLFCGSPTADLLNGRPYCAFHYRLSIQPKLPRGSKH